MTPVLQVLIVKLTFLTNGIGTECPVALHEYTVYPLISEPIFLGNYFRDL